MLTKRHDSHWSTRIVNGKVSPEVDSLKICHVITSFLSVCVENDNFGDVRPKATWLAFTKIVFVYFVFHSPSFCRKELFKLSWFYIGCQELFLLR